MTRPLSWFPFLLLGTLLLMEGCLGVGSYQPPEIQPPGEKTLGLGIPMIAGGSVDDAVGVLLLPEIYGRVGLGHRMDFGWRFPLFLFGGSGFLLNLNGDLRYEVVTMPGATAILTLRGNLWMTNGGYLLLASPLMAAGVGRNLWAVGPVLMASSDASSGLLGLRMEWVREFPISWGVVRPALSLTVLSEDPGLGLWKFWILTVGAGYEVSLSRLIRAFAK